MKQHSQDEVSPPCSLLECRPESQLRVDAQDGGIDRAARFKTATAAVAGIAVAIAIYLLRMDAVVGLFKDDGWYVVLAKSLATGHGYTLINLPQPAGRYFYPPFFPFLLSLLYRVSPEFPRNVALLKSLSVISMLLLSVVLFRLFNRQDRLPRSMAYLLALSTALAPSFVMLATSSVMSECVFTALQFAALLFAERCARNRRDRAEPGNACAAALLASAAYLTRTVGVALLAGIVIALLKRKLFKEVGVFVAVVLLCVGSWEAYKHFSISGSRQSAPVVAGYSAQFWDRNANFPGTKVTARDLPGRVWQVATVIIADDIGALLVPSLYRSGGESGEEVVDMTTVIPMVSRNPIHEYGGSMGLAAGGQLFSFALSIPVLIGFFASVKRDIGPMELVCAFAVLIVAIWPASPMRYLVPLLPFFLYYLALGVAEICQLLRKLHRRLNLPLWSASRIVVVCILALFLYDNALYIAAKQMSPSSFGYPNWLVRFDAERQAALWVREHTPENEVVTGDNLPMLYLYSHRATEMCDFDECVQKGIRYYVNTEVVYFPLRAKTAFQAPYHGVEVFDIQSVRH